MQSREVVAVAATILTVCLYFTGIPICLKIFRHGNTTEASFFPLMVMFMSSVLWTKYGLLRADRTLIFVNTVGAVLGFLYVFFYYQFTHARRPLHWQLTIGAFLLFPPLIYVKFYAENYDEAMYYMGYTCAAASILAYASPLSAMAEVISTRSTATMAFPLSFANFLVSGHWYLYGFLLKDYFIQVPNAIGALFGIIQLMLFWKYPSSSRTPHTSDSSVPTLVSKL